MMGLCVRKTAAGGGCTHPDPPFPNSQELGLLTGLNEIYLKANGMQETALPTEIGLLQQVTAELVLTENNLSGGIPTQVLTSAIAARIVISSLASSSAPLPPLPARCAHRPDQGAPAKRQQLHRGDPDRTGRSERFDARLRGRAYSDQ